MLDNQGIAEQPFWKDESNPYSSSLAPRYKLAERVALGIGIMIRLWSLLGLFGIAMLFALKYPVVWILIAAMAAWLLFLYARIAFRLRNRPSQAKAAEIQRLARERTGAELIGSALHVAGHPLLQVKQPVVLALKADELSIYSYGSPVPLDTIIVHDIQKAETVVFDDEYVPHTNVVDDTAQALQLTFQWRGTTVVCSFRRMYVVRPIEWYQAIQARRSLLRA